LQLTNHIIVDEKDFIEEATPAPVSTLRAQPEALNRGSLIVNADDWGRNVENTDRILDCVAAGAVSSVSAMVFMTDSERAANIVREQGIDAGLHLNLTTPFSAHSTPARVKEHQGRIARYLAWHRFGYVVFHPGLRNSFEYVVSQQLEEFQRVYGHSPERIDGHHHAHLCANVLLGKLLPQGTVVRRSFCFRSGEKSLANRMYRAWVDRRLAQRHRLADYFFALDLLEPRDRLIEKLSYAREFNVEIETHPVNCQEYDFLRGGELFRVCGDIPVARRYALGVSGQVESQARSKRNSGAVPGQPGGRRAPRATVVVGFAEAIPAPEVVWSLVDEGFEVVAFARKGRSSALRHSRHVVCHEICAPETDVQAALSDLKLLLASIKENAASPHQVLLPLDDKALFLCSKLEMNEGWLLAGAEGAHAELALSKYVQVQLAKAAGFRIPPTALARTADEVRDFVAASSYPVILKSANCILIEDGKVKSCPHWICANDEELESALTSWAGRVPLLVQPFIEGTGEGIFGLATPDGVRAWSAHRRLRMMNPQGSGSSACVSQLVPEELKQQAEDFINRTGWRGMFMVELLRDEAGEVFFVEFNGRPWGSMALSRRQHLEYPAWQVMLTVDQNSRAGMAAPNTPGIVSRNAGRELMHLLFVLRGPKSKALSSWPSIWKCLRDVGVFRRGETLYNWRRDDPKVFFADVSYTVKSNLLKGVH
jgi:chitin disaccharide deacetylase